MDEHQINYYHIMFSKNRLIPIYTNNKVSALLTYFLGDKDDRQDMWDIPAENKESTTLNIDHLLSRDKNNKYYAIQIWHDIKEYFKKTFPHIKEIKWNKAGGKPRCIQLS